MSVAVASRSEAEINSQPDEMDLLYRRWKSALKVGALPPYEDVALGGLGRLNEHLAIIRSNEGGRLEVLRAGQHFETWLGTKGESALVDDLRIDCALALTDCINVALQKQEPSRSIAHHIRDGVVETLDLMALPLKSLWGPPLFLVLIKRHERRYSLVETIFDATDEGMLALEAVYDDQRALMDFRIIALNEGAARLMSQPREALQWKRLSESKFCFSARNLLERLATAITTCQQSTLEVSYTEESVTRYLKIAIVPVGDLLSLTLTDVGDIKSQEQSFRLLFESNPIPMWLLDQASLRFLNVNDAAVLHYGYSRVEFMAMSALDIRPVGQRDSARQLLTGLTDAYVADEAWLHIKSDGSPIEVLPYLRVLVADAKPTILAALFDVTERRKAEARIVHMAHHDALTNLPNRVLFRERLEDALTRVRRHGENLAVLCLDLDHFKSVNDTLGHPIGDKLLQAVADRFRCTLRETDFVARLGGDEFAVIQTAIDGPADASGFAVRVIEEISKPYNIDGHQVVIGTSIGVAISPENGLDADILLKNADMALYRAKADGRNTFRFFEHAMDVKLQARRLLEIDLRTALAVGQFEVYYQPLVNVQSNSVSGFEALVRWHHPQRGMVSPADFIPLAEEIGLIVSLGEWVLRQACAEAAAWPERFSIAVNLSPMQFKSHDLVSLVEGALASTGLQASRLELEITESVLLHDSETNLSILRELRALGVRISMDDFGTGYSSLGYLQRFPFDKIKIDQSFVKALSVHSESHAIIRAVAGLGLSLGISTTAEGVETEDQLDQLRAEGCTEVQGYLFSRPRPASELGPLLHLPLALRAAATPQAGL